MFFEYALEPAVLSSWQSVRYFLDGFGPWKGRFLVEYPRRWKRLVFEGLQCGDVEKHKIIEKLQQLDPRALSPRRGSAYEAGQPWKSNATAEHARAPFRAVIVAEGPAHEPLVEADSVTEAHPLWRVEPGAEVARNPAAFVQALDLLIRSSAHVAIIDPYFRADHGDKLQALLHLCRAVAGRDVVVDVHACDGSLEQREFLRLAQRAVPQNIPVGMSVTFRIWSERRGGERFHNRYIVTDIGGVQFGDGIERGEAGQFDRLSILGADERQRLWGRFYGAPLAFDLAGQLVIASTQ